jgi:small subunit ribosomal protein S14
MAKKSSIARNLKRIQLSQKYAAKRKELKEKLKAPTLTEEEFYSIQEALDSLPRNSSFTRIRNRCSITGRPRGYYRYFGISRITLREMALSGCLAGVTKASW